MQLLRPMRAGRKETRMPLPLTATRTAVRLPRVAADVVVLEGGLVA